MKQVVIETSKIEWPLDENKSVSLDRMNTDHIIRALGWCENRRRMAESVSDKVPLVFHEQLFSHHGRKLSEWTEIFSAVLFSRAEEATATRRAELQAELEALEGPEKKIARLQSELEKLQ